MKKDILIGLITMLWFCSCNGPAAKKGEAALPALLSNQQRHASCVYLTKDEQQNPVASWCESDDSTKEKFFFIAFFDKGNNHFSAPIRVPIEQNTSIHEEGMPKIAIKGNGTIVAIYETSSPTKTNQWAGFIRYMLSSDKGKTWSQPKYLSKDTSAGTDHSFASITRLSDGEVGASWLDESFDPKIPGRPVVFAKTNGANEFGKEILIDSLACECCRTAISSSDNGKVGIVFRNILNGSIRDMSIAVSDNNGNSFSKAVSFSNDGWVVNGCPHNGPSVSTDNKKMFAAWFTGGNPSGVYYAELDENKKIAFKKKICGNARYIQLCVMPGGERMMAFNKTVLEGDSVYGKIVVGKVVDGQFFQKDISSAHTHASYPVIQVLGKNNVVVAWSENNHVYCSIINTNSVFDKLEESAISDIEAPDFSKVQFASNKDLSCGMPLRAGIKDTAHYKGKVYGFCSKECKDEFKKNPEAYIAKIK